MAEFWTAVASGLAGFGLKAIYDRFIFERTVPATRLAERLSEGLQVGRHGLARVTELGRERLSDWNSLLEVSRVVSHPTLPSAEGKVVVLARHSSLGAQESHCPSKREGRTILFVRARSGLREAIGSARSLCAEASPRTELLVRSYLGNSEHRLCVWISAPELEVESAEELGLHVEECLTALSPWVPVDQLVLEVSIPSRVAGTWSVLRPECPILIGSGTGGLHAGAGSGARYQHLRDAFDALLERGLRLGSLCLPDELPIPADLLRRRLRGEDWDRLASCDGWTKALIVGPPGAGKTELCHLLVEDIVEKSAAIVITIGPENLRVRCAFEALSQSTGSARPGRLRELTRALGEIAPEGLIDDDRSLRAFGDALLAVITESRRPVVVLVDDLHADGEMRAAVLRLQNWGTFKYLLVGRTTPVGLDTPGVTSLHLEPWDSRDARAMLTAWSNEGEPEHDLISDPSVYFLRMIRRNAGLNGSDPATLLRAALAAHLSSVESGLPPLGKTSADAAQELASVVEMLEQGRAREEILGSLSRKRDAGVIDLLGLLAWVGRFNQEDLLLLVDDMVKWSDGLLTSTRHAEALLRLGREAGIFGRGDASSSFWRNTFIADACAAVYCINRRQDWSEETMAEMVVRFKNTGSLGILDLALETSERFVFIELLAKIRPDAIELVADLVSGDFAQRAAESELAEHLTRRLFQLAGRTGLDPSLVPALSVAVARLARASEGARQEVSRAVSREDTGGLLAIGVEALLLPPDAGFFGSLAARGVSPGRAFLMASSLWPEASLDVLLERGVTPRSAEEHALFRAGWSAWIGRHERDALEDLVTAVLAMKNLGAPAQEILGLVLREALERIRTLRPGERDFLLMRCGGWIRSLMECGHDELASAIASNYAALLDRDLGRPRVRWIVSRDGSCAIPREPFEETSVGEILRTLELQPTIRLPSVRELQTMPGGERESEIVRDRLPRGFVPGTSKILPVNLGTWDGARSSYVKIPPATPNEQIGVVLARRRVRWRPVVVIQRPG